jgi:CBS domain-containing protein
MSTDLVTVNASMPLKELISEYFFGSGQMKHQSYPVVSHNGKLLGLVTCSRVLAEWSAAMGNVADMPDFTGLDAIVASDLIERDPITLLPWESCRRAAERMAEAAVGRVLIVSADDRHHLLGIVTRSDLLKPPRPPRRT